jgi:hypothetical protein
MPPMQRRARLDSRASRMRGDSKLTVTDWHHGLMRAARQ